MKEYDFDLTFELSDPSVNPDIYLDDLYEAGCDDALIGIGRNGFIAFVFGREAESDLDAIISAMHDVHKVIPDAKLIGAYDF